MTPVEPDVTGAFMSKLIAARAVRIDLIGPRFLPRWCELSGNAVALIIALREMPVSVVEPDPVKNY